jgi:clan AA aspartic protease
MIRGSVTEQREAVVTIEIEDPTGAPIPIEVIVDTGFNGFLTLPTAALKELSASRVGQIAVILADGSESFCDLYELSIRWNGNSRVVEVDSAETAPLLGMALLDGSVVTVDATIGGLVTIAPR